MGFSYGVEFQRGLIASLLDVSFLRNVCRYIKPEHFSDELQQAVVEFLIEFFQKYEEIPTREVAATELESYVAEGRNLAEYLEEMELIYDSHVNVKFYQDKILDFLKSQSLRNALQEAELRIESGDTDSVHDLIRQSTALVTPTIAHNYLDHIKDRALQYRNQAGVSRLPTGLGELDIFMNGGLAPGELGLFVAPPGGGKTTSLINVATHALLAGHEVLYVSLELSSHVISSKFDSRLLGMTYEELRTRPKAFYLAMQSLRKTILGKLHIVEFPTKSIRVADLSHLLFENPGIDMVVVDFADLLSPPASRKERYMELTEIYERLRQLGGEHKARVWTASQGNRNSATSAVINMEHVAGDFNKIGIVDIAVSINQTPEDAQLNQARLFILKSRIGKSKVSVLVNVDWSLSKITPLIGDL